MPDMIDQFQFISLSRPYPKPIKKITREIRSGVNGVTHWDTGTRSEPIQLFSVVDCIDVAAAWQLYRDYQTKLNAFAPVNVKWAGENSDPLKIIILNVDVVERGLTATLLGVGGINGTSNALLRCRWDVEIVDTSN